MVFQGSLTARLTWLYGMSTAVLLIVVSSLLYTVLTHALEQEDRRQLDQKLNTLRVILLYQDGDARALEQEVLHEGAEELGTRVLGRNGDVLLASPWLDPQLPTSAFPRVTVGHTGFQEGHFGRKTYWLGSAAVDSSGGQSWTVQVALDVSTDQTVLEKYRHYLAMCILGGILFAMTVGYYIARRGLRPLTTMAQVAERITATQLHERLDHSALPAELKALAKSFDAMLIRLEDSFQRLSRFSADLAHELRTPLNNLMGEAEVALARARTVEEYQHLLGSSLEEYGRLARMLDSLLFLARVEHAQMAVKVAPLDGRAELEALARYQGVLAEEQGVMLTCEGEGQVLADADLFRRAVNNLLSNALRHTPAGGSIRLIVRTTEDGTDIEVRDTGSGIDAGHLTRLGERFYRAGVQDQHGSGLGLAIVRSIMDLHGGRMTLDSLSGNGTSVSLHFPG